MELFDVYPLNNISLNKAKNTHVFDNDGTKYLDFYGGHAVISIGHNNKIFRKALTKQLRKLAYYSNSVKLEIQQKYANKLSDISGCDDYNIFMCNSGAEAIENALKIASFHNKKKKVIAFNASFHGRTAGAVAITDNASIKAPINDDSHVIFLPLNDKKALINTFKKDKDICAVIIEPIQGVAGIIEAELEFLQLIQDLCNKNNAVFIADEIQCGCGRTGKYFAHQWAGVQPHLITMAKGIGNGFPVAAVLIHSSIEAKHGMLGSTFGGGPLACAAAIAVIDEIEANNLMQNAQELGEYIISKLSQLPHIKSIRGKGLIIGLEFDFPINDLRNQLLYEEKIFTGNASNKNTLRLLPSLTIKKEHIDSLFIALEKLIKE
jgi:acetylornithine/N-succinyldiaminopimelate aminotransferase